MILSTKRKFSNTDKTPKFVLLGDFVTITKHYDSLDTVQEIAQKIYDKCHESPPHNITLKTIPCPPYFRITHSKPCIMLPPVKLNQEALDNILM